MEFDLKQSFWVFFPSTSGGFVEVTFDHCNKLLVLAEACVVKRVVTQAVDHLHVSATFQQHLHRVLAAVLTAQNQRRPEGDTQQQIRSENMHKPAVLQLCYWRDLCEALKSKHLKNKNSLEIIGPVYITSGC